MMPPTKSSNLPGPLSETLAQQHLAFLGADGRAYAVHALVQQQVAVPVPQPLLRVRTRCHTNAVMIIKSLRKCKCMGYMCGKISIRKSSFRNSSTYRPTTAMEIKLLQGHIKTQANTQRTFTQADHIQMGVRKS